MQHHKQSGEEIKNCQTQPAGLQPKAHPTRYACAPLQNRSQPNEMANCERSERNSGPSHSVLLHGQAPDENRTILTRSKTVVAGLFRESYLTRPIDFGSQTIFTKARIVKACSL